MSNSIIVLMIAALMTAAAAGWTLRAYRVAGGGAVTAKPALFACGAVALIALIADLAIGRPELPDAPYRARLETLISALRSPTPPPLTLEQEVAVWTYISRQRPRDPVPHLEAGKALLSLGRPREAAIEFDRALRIEPDSSEALIDMGRALVSLEGRVTPEALNYFRQAGAQSDEPAPWIYQTLAAVEDGRVDDARRLCGEAVTRGAPPEMCRRLIGSVGARRTAQ